MKALGSACESDDSRELAGPTSGSFGGHVEQTQMGVW